MVIRYSTLVRVAFVLAFCAGLIVADARAESPILTGPIEVFGNDKIRDSVILREIPLQTGQPFSYSLLEAGRRNLWRVPGIDYAEITVAYQTADSSLGLRVFVTEQSTLSGNVWLERGYEDDLSLGLRATDVSFRGTGQKVDASAVVINNALFRLGWENPWVRGPHVGVGARVSYRSYRYVYDDFGSALAGARIRRSSVGFSVFRNLGARSRLSAQAEYEWAEGGVEGITIDPSGDRYPLFELGIDWDRRDNVPYPHKGTYVRLRGRSIGPFDDLYSIGEGVADVRAFVPMFGRAVVAAHAVLVMRDGHNIPVYRRQHIGGGNTLRGWDYGSFHGRNSLVGGMEYRVPLNFTRSEPLGDVLLGIEVHAFADFGGAWERPGDLDDNTFHGSAGVGVGLLNRQIEGLRFDYGWRRGAKGRFHFEIGMKF